MGAVAQNFTILPVSQFNQQFIKRANVSKKHKRVLVIDDDYDMSLIISRSLKVKYGCTVDIANDPFEAINLIVEKFYDLIILDWQLPGLNGAETLVEAEKGLRFEPSIPIQWDTSRAPVVILSSSKKSECPPRKTKHFNYIGYVSKIQPLDDIINLLGTHIIKENETSISDAIISRMIKFG